MQTLNLAGARVKDLGGWAWGLVCEYGDGLGCENVVRFTNGPATTVSAGARGEVAVEALRDVVAQVGGGDRTGGDVGGVEDHQA